LDAATITSFCNCFFTNLYCSRIKELESSFFWPTWTELTSDLPAYFKVGIPSAVMLMLDWGSFEILAIFSGLMGVAENGA
jgi:Na+-driven multidrug efflux pump